MGWYSGLQTRHWTFKNPVLKKRLCYVTLSILLKSCRLWYVGMKYVLRVDDKGKFFVRFLWFFFVFRVCVEYSGFTAS